MFRPVVIVMVKAPRAGEVKTRLMPPLSGAEAAALAGCFACDVVENVSRIISDVIIAYAPPSGRATLEALLPLRRGLMWLEQKGESLGARLDAVANEASLKGFSPLVIVGADSPTLPHTFISDALDALNSDATDITLGPTDDGGYYLVGLRRPFAGLFANVAWSTEQAYRQTADNAARLGLRLKKLSQWYDVDTPADLLRLRAELSRDEDARCCAPHTHRWLLEHQG